MVDNVVPPYFITRSTVEVHASRTRDLCDELTPSGVDGSGYPDGSLDVDIDSSYLAHASTWYGAERKVYHPSKSCFSE